jgi:hypothetical protein
MANLESLTSQAQLQDLLKIISNYYDYKDKILSMLASWDVLEEELILLLY